MDSQTFWGQVKLGRPLLLDVGTEEGCHIRFEDQRRPEGTEASLSRSRKNGLKDRNGLMHVDAMGKGDADGVLRGDALEGHLCILTVPPILAIGLGMEARGGDKRSSEQLAEPPSEQEKNWDPGQMQYPAEDQKNVKQDFLHCLLGTG